MAPVRRATIPGTTAWVAITGARRSTSKIRSKRFIGSSRSPGNVIAALFTRMSTGPSSATVVATIASTSASTARLVGTAIARPPASVMRRTVSSTVPGSGSGVASVARAAHATATPSAASATAVAAPTPRLAPVTTATFPESSTPRTLPKRGQLLGEGEVVGVEVAELGGARQAPARLDRERVLLLGVERVGHLVPRHRRGDRRPGTDPQGVDGDRGLVVVVLAPVDEHPVRA